VHLVGLRYNGGVIVNRKEIISTLTYLREVADLSVSGTGVSLTVQRLDR